MSEVMQYRCQGRIATAPRHEYFTEIKIKLHRGDVHLCCPNHAKDNLI
jgi:hypothetical protein